MNARSLIAVAALGVALALPGAAAAQSVAYAVGDGYTNMREGPGPGYRVIARLYPGTRVDILGCLETRDWCDSIVEDTRGWISTTRLEFAYGGRRVFVPDYYPYFDAPVVIFRFGGQHRHHRYRDDDGRRFRDHRHRDRAPDFNPDPSDGGQYGSPTDPSFGGPSDGSVFEHRGGRERGPDQFVPSPGGSGPSPAPDLGPPPREIPGKQLGPGGTSGGCSPSDPSCMLR